MVKKLFKHEFMYYFKTLIIFLPILLIGGVCGRIVLSFITVDRPEVAILIGGTFMMLYFATMAVLILMMVLAIVRFYKNLFGAEGYLTLTLPVSVNKHVFVKLITVILWEVIILTVICLSWGIVFTGVPEIFAELSAALKPFMTSQALLKLLPFGIEILVLYPLSSASGLLIYYSCMCIGQLAKKHRILLSVGVYFGYYLLLEIFVTISSIAVTTTLLAMIDKIDFVFIAENIITILHVFMISSIVLTFLFDFLLFKFVTFIVDKKLNLE